jgi:Hemerythrin HHE cation binding domain
VTAVQEFTEVFRAEHRQVRDLLLELVRAFADRDVEHVRSLVAAVAAATGTHFRYEEEAIYPQLVGIFGDAYVGKLLAGHDGAIRNTRELLWLAGNDPLTREQAERGAELARAILPHVSDCDGLAIMIETLPSEVASQILAARSTALDASLDLLTRAATERHRPVQDRPLWEARA